MQEQVTQALNQVWVWIVGSLSGISLAGIISAIIYGCLKGAFSKTVKKLDVEKISETVIDKGLKKIQNVAFSQSIQPIVESELQKITEQANTYVHNEIEEMKCNYEKIVNILESLGAYFDNSAFIPEQTKKDFQEAVIEAKNVPISVQTIKVVEPVIEPYVEEPKPTQSPNKEKEKKGKVAR